MHELGHTLGLHHGGSDDEGFKPNYFSVMNYLWQMPDGRYGPWKLDFSRSALPSLDENNLTEAAGIGGRPNATVPIGPGDFANGVFDIVDENGPVNWDGVGGTTGVNIARNINSQDPGATGHLTELVGHEDWSELIYDFRKSPAFASGFIAIVNPDHFELTPEFNEPPVDQAGDFDADGDVDGRDFLVWQRGGSRTPLSTADLEDWQDHYGEEELSAISSQLPDSQGSIAQNRETAVGSRFWILDSMLSQQFRKAKEIMLSDDMVEELAVDRVFDDLEIVPRTAIREFGDIAVRRAPQSRLAVIDFEFERF